MRGIEENKTNLVLFERGDKFSVIIGSLSFSAQMCKGEGPSVKTVDGT